MRAPSYSRLLAGATLALLVLACLGVGGPSSAQPAGTGVDRFGACLAAQRSGQLLLMIDESSSLQNTDPQANRVGAAKYLARQLADYADRTGVTIDVSIAGFSSDYTQELGWTKLDKNALPQVESTLDSFKTRNTGNDTDYWSALDGARASLANAPKPSEGPRCQALAWFTDGKLDFSQADATKSFAPGINLNSQAGVDAAIKAAQESICRERGVADQIRSSGIVMFAVGLSPKPQDVPDFDLIKAIATGEPSGTVASCGAITSPIPGDFYLAQNIEDLLFAFDKVGSPDQQPIETTSGACARVICEEAKHRFVLDRSVRSVSVLAAADRPGLVPYLVAPDGTSLDLSGAAKTGTLGGVTVDSRPQSDKSVSFRMAESDSPLWQGVWALVYVDPTGDAKATTRSSIHIAGDLFPAAPDAAKTILRSGEKPTVSFVIVDGTRKPVDPMTLLGRATFSAVLVDAKGAEHTIASDLTNGQLAPPQVVDLSVVPPGSAILRLTLGITTADAHETNGVVVPGTKLTPQRVDLPVNVAPPAGYPTVEGRVDFGKLEGAGALSASLKVKGPGCVWLPSDAKNTVQGAPDGAGDITVSSSANTRGSCVKVADGEEKSLPITMSVPNAATGAANGTIEVQLGPDTADGKPVTVDVAYTASLEKPLNTFNFVLALITALVLGPGLPLALLYLAKWWVSRIPARGLHAQQIPVRISGDTVLRENGPFALAPGELTHLVPGLDGPARRLDLDSGVSLQARMGWAPFGVGYVVAKASGRCGAAGRSGATTGTTPDAKLPLAVHNNWFVLHDPAGPAELATVVILASVDADDQMVQGLVNDIAGALPRVLTDLRARAVPPAGGQHPPAPDAEPNPFGDQSTNPFAASGSPSGNPFGGSPFGGSPSPGGNPFGGSPAPGGSPFGGSPSPGGNQFGGGTGPSAPPTSPGSNPFA